MLDYNSILQARENIGDYVQQTLLIELADNIYLKLENTHERVNAFKIRGAYNKIKYLGNIDEVVTAAVGSHGFAVGDICNKLGIQSICFMPKTAPDGKKRKMESLVDRVEYAGDEFSETEQEALKYAEHQGLPFVHPYNDELIIAGQGTIGLEIYDGAPDVANIYVPIGGGGLLSGVAIALSTLNPEIQIVGVQPNAMHAMTTSVRRGEITSVDRNSSVAEPLCVNLNPHTITYGLVNQYVDRFILPTEDEIKEAMALIHERTGCVVEGAGAIGLAAALKDKGRIGKSVCVVSGGNIDQKRFFDEISRE